MERNGRKKKQNRGMEEWADMDEWEMREIRNGKIINTQKRGGVEETRKGKKWKTKKEKNRSM